jgi:hypothetical protein
MKGLNLSGFKKIKQDAKSTTLKHPLGHMIVIAHSALPEHRRAELNKLPFAEGGEVDMKKSGMSPKDNTSPASETKRPARHEDESPRLNQGDREDGSTIDPRQKFAEGTPHDTIDVNPSAQMPDNLINPNAGQQSDMNAVRVTPPGAQDPGAMPYGVSPQDAAPPPPISNQPQAGATQQMERPSASPQPTMEDDRFGQATQSKMMKEGYKMRQAGNTMQAVAEMSANDAAASALHKQIETQQKNVQEYQQHLGDLNSERQAFMEDVKNQHVDPNRYMSSLGFFGGIANAIGLIAGGISGGVLRQENPALKYMQTQIDNDINAQKAELGKKENLLSANMRQFGNLRDATEMTKVMQTDIMANQLKEAAAKAGNPMAQARLLEAAGKLEMDAAPVMSQIAMRKTMLSGAAQGRIDPEMMIRINPYGVPPGQQEAALKELSQARNMIAARDNLLSAFDQVGKMQTLGNRVLNPYQSSRQIEALVGPLIEQLAKDNEGRVTPTTVEYLRKLMTTFGDNEETKQRNRAALNNFVSEKMHFSNLKSVGIDPQTLGRYNQSGQSKITETPIQ